MGGYRYDGVSGAVVTNTIVNFTGFQPTGLTAGNILGVALYCWSGNYYNGSGYWTPVTNKMLAGLSH